MPSKEKLTADVAMFLHGIGWKGVLDGQWEGLAAGLPALRDLIASGMESPTPPSSKDEMRAGLLKAYDLLAYGVPDPDLTNATSSAKWMEECDAWLDKYAPSKLSSLQGETPCDAEATALQFIGWLSVDVPELHGVEVPRLRESWERFKGTRAVVLGTPKAAAVRETKSPHPDTERLDWMDSAAADVEYSRRAGETQDCPEVNAPDYPWARRRTLREAIDAARGEVKTSGEPT
jgi:hypothetical protein